MNIQNIKDLIGETTEYDKKAKLEKKNQKVGAKALVRLQMALVEH